MSHSPNSVSLSPPTYQRACTCKARLLILVVHGGHMLEPGGGDPGAKAGDVATLAEVLDRVARAQSRTATAEHIQIRLVPCPAVCAEAFSLVSNLNPYSYDESCVSSSVDYLPLAALPLLAISAPRYLDAVATLIIRANRVYRSFLQSEDGRGFTGQVCLVGDCVGGVLCFDALCFSSGPPCRSPGDSSGNNSTESLKDPPRLLDGASPSLGSSKRLSKSNIDVSAAFCPGSGRGRNLSRKQSDLYDGDSTTSGQGSFFCRYSSAPLQREGGIDADSSSKVGLSPGHLDFQVSHCFLLGCPLGLVLAMRRSVLPGASQLQPACSQIYNLFYPLDPCASRLEPLLHPSFHKLPPFAVPRYQRNPMGDGRSAVLGKGLYRIALRRHASFSFTTFCMSLNKTAPSVVVQQQKTGLMLYTYSSFCMTHIQIMSHSFRPSVHAAAAAASVDRNCTLHWVSMKPARFCHMWWGTKRLDYALHCPDVLTAFPTAALPPVFHSSYWESTDVVSFVLRQVMRCDCLSSHEAEDSNSAPFSPSGKREKWLRRRTHVKLRNVTANHRVNDIIATEKGPQTLVGRFMYGPLDMVTLTGEKVDVFLVTQPPSGRWVHYDTVVTSSSGKVTYTIPQNKRLGVGVYPIKMVVKGDQTSAEACLTVLPRGTECVVFSIDGSFAASVSLMGRDPKVRPGAVDVVRHWQDLGYLIIYITGRPDMQKQRVVSWLSQHNFPQGAVFFSEGLVHDPLRQKTIFLRNLVQECHIKICAAYGSMKDISVYSMLGISPTQIYIVGRPSKKHQNQCQFLSEGYASHLSALRFGQRARSKKTPSAGRMVLRKGSFGLSTKPDFLRKRAHLRRTMSVQQVDPPFTAMTKPERAQSQPESDKEHRGRGGGGGVGPWGRGRSVWPRGSMYCENITP
uniref:PITP-less RdgB-like protein n=1 Tax=Scleropages formosus TaxID=113540 RepID=A0A8C9VSF4_SCLFO